MDITPSGGGSRHLMSAQWTKRKRHGKPRGMDEKGGMDKGYGLSGRAMDEKERNGIPD